MSRSAERAERARIRAEELENDKCKSHITKVGVVAAAAGIGALIGYGAASSFDHGKEGAGIGAAAGLTILAAGYGFFKCCKKLCTFDDEIRAPLVLEGPSESRPSTPSP